MKIQRSVGNKSGRMENFTLKWSDVCDVCRVPKPENDILWYLPPTQINVAVCPKCQSEQQRADVKRRIKSMISRSLLDISARQTAISTQEAKIRAAKARIAGLEAALETAETGERRKDG